MHAKCSSDEIFITFFFIFYFFLEELGMRVNNTSDIEKRWNKNIFLFKDSNKDLKFCRLT